MTCFLRYFEDGKELVAQILDKQKELPEDVGEDFSKAESFHRMHAAFERDISTLGKQVQHRKSGSLKRTTQQAVDKRQTLMGEERENISAVVKSGGFKWLFISSVHAYLYPY